MIGLTPDELLSIKNELEAVRMELEGQLTTVSDEASQISTNILNVGMKSQLSELRSQLETSRKNVWDEMQKLLEFLVKQVGDYQNSEEQTANKITSALNQMENIVNS